MEKCRKKLNNAGMSLVEIIVVVLIMGILSAGVVVGFTFIRNRDASSAAEALLTALNRAKIQTTASDGVNDITLRVVADSDGYTAKILKSGTVIDEVEIGDSALTIVAKNDDGSISQTVSGTNVCDITFQKSNGAFTSGYTKLIVTGSKTVTVHMVTSTGRSYIE